METNGFSVELKDVSKSYNKKTNVINEMNLSVRPGEFLVFLGPSGCGKSTTLRMIAGLENPTGGHILINGHDSAAMTSRQRNIAMVFQDYALYPNMTVYQNLEYALRVRKVPKKTRQQRLSTILASLNLSDYKDRYPAQLSGGQKQRVALGRGMAKKSNIFLLDEPLSNIDVQLREKARDQLLQLHAENGQTIIYVTHDQQEAMALGDRIAVINDGKIQMIDTPDNLYRHPTNLFVAQFVGTPQINILPVNFSNHQLTGVDGTVISRPGKNIRANLDENQSYLLGIRPENVHLHDQQVSGSFPVEVQTIVDYGRYKQLTCKAFGEKFIKAVVNQWPKNATGTACATLDESAMLLFDPNTNQNVLDAQSNYVLE
ncbi:MAG: ABC transporter ATP-binding protein [Lentilactobacillus buchneri]|jgi:sn-glycerol 3-phosphate transport system ATP-binding protein/multiple sugar transport system ATP-binding protein|nr:ABC transporter ATP-binding protein [Lentilactobacillus buchneri]